VPIALAIGRTALERRHWRQVGLLAVPPLTLAIWIALTVVLLAVGEPPSSGPLRVAAFLLWVGVFVVAAIASTVAVSAAALDAEVDGSLYRRAALPAVATAVAMAFVVASVVAWGIGLAIVSPADFWGFDGILSSSTPLTWLGIVVVMAGATWVALRAALRARDATNPPAA
jgi:ABC-type transport system involved in cytochrome c biogenesis permease component